MFKISEIRIHGQSRKCVTDKEPVISFSLDSDTENERLKKAFIYVNNEIIETDKQVGICYMGKLKPFTEYKVIVKAEAQSGAYAEADTFFGTGRLDTAWAGKWITDEGYTYEDGESPIPMEFHYVFETKKKTISRAWVNATALGIYELHLNREKVGNDYFSPGYTSYEHVLQYQTYDITEKMTEKNEITAIVAGGWAAGLFHMKRKSKIYTDRPAFLCEFHIIYSDGEEQIIVSDDHWEVSLDSCFRSASFYDGEIFDATYIDREKKYKRADVTVPGVNPAILAEYGAPVRRHEVFKPVSVFRSKSGEVIYDFGQNFAGVISAKLKGKQGQEIVFRHAEILVDNELFVKPLRTAKATVTYICKEGEQEYTPKLTYMGFRYVGVTGIEEKEIELEAWALWSEMEETGEFTCSNELINRLENNIRWSGKSNFVDIPTDCPQRDERLGWTGDIAVFAQTACLYFDMERFLDKWLLDLNMEQDEKGGIPFVIPRGADTWKPMPSACWGDSCVLVPWAEYKARGNKELLKRQYPVMKKFLEACKKKAGFLSLGKYHSYIWSLPYQWGDWCAPDTDMLGWWKRAKWVATAYFAHSCRIIAQIAKELGKEQDSRYYEDLFYKISQAYEHVFTDGNGKLKKEFQSAYVLPLAFGMVSEDKIENMVDNLYKLIQKNAGHLATGFPGTPYILYAFSDNGRADLAYELLLKETCPSWLYEVKTGATTIWERWDALRPDGTVNFGDGKSDEDSDGGMVSFNHYANGAVGDWLFHRCLGLEAVEAGYKTFIFRPFPGGDIRWAEGSLKTPYGRINARWERNQSEFIMKVKVPVSAVCRIIFPDGEERMIESGVWELQKKLDS